MSPFWVALKNTLIAVGHVLLCFIIIIVPLITGHPWIYGVYALCLLILFVIDYFLQEYDKEKDKQNQKPETQETWI
jgi:type III secretory pathway component EscU